MSSIRAVFAIIGILSVGLTGLVPASGMVTHSQMTVLTLKRVKTTRGTVIGKLYVNNKLECYTLEDEETEIPAGTYKLQVGYSEKFEHNIIRLLHVPGRTNIEIHPGNTKDDARGCILVGKSHTDLSVIASRGALTHLLKQIQTPAEIVVQDAQLS
jgi:hypothetical protein